jgi:hypothetical protein
VGAPRILLGTSAYAAAGDGARRQGDALASWTALPQVRLANLQWEDEAFDVPGLPTHRVLQNDSRRATGRAGPRKPVVPEVLDRLSELAADAGCRWLAFANSDVRVTPEAVERVLSGGLEGYAFSRTETDPAGGRAEEVSVAGVDLLVLSVGWWRANRRRFRPYLVGEPVWDNVYTAILLCHARAALLNREPLLLHERHPAAWAGSPFAEHVRLLAALDRPYFTLWARYHDALLRLRAGGAGEDEEMALQRRVFRFAPTPAERVVQGLRAGKARLRHALARRRSSR